MKQHDQEILPSCRANLTTTQMQEIFEQAEHIEVKLKKSPVKMSVVLPYFRAGFIGWVPLESFIRQKNVSCNWELIICEENFDNPFGLVKILSYMKELEKVGCVRIKYIELKSWLPLSAKWYFLIQSTEKSSRVVLFNSADLYSGVHRFERQYKILSGKKFNWYKLVGNLIYDIGSDKHVKRVSMAKERPDTACRAVTMELARKLPLAPVKQSVDGWTFNTLEKEGVQIYYDESDLWETTVNINGMNNISIGRSDRIINVTYPLEECCTSLKRHLPVKVIEKLDGLREHIDDHTRIREESKISLK